MRLHACGFISERSCVQRNKCAVKIERIAVARSPYALALATPDLLAGNPAAKSLTKTMTMIGHERGLASFASN
jgi:hypothetical protein